MFGRASNENCVVICRIHCINEWNGVAERAGRSMRASFLVFAGNALTILRLLVHQNGKVAISRETTEIPEPKAC